MNGEDVFEETPVRSTAKEFFTHRHKRREIDDGVGRKMVKLGSKEVHKTPEKGVRRKRKTTVDVGGEQDTLIRSRLRLHLPSDNLTEPSATNPSSASSSRSSCRSEDPI